MMCKCLYCYKELEEGQKDFHPGCARKFFGTKDVPKVEYRHEDLDRLAEQVIRAQTSLTGVQPKLSLNLSKHEGCSQLTIVGLWGGYIFKPQTESYTAAKGGIDALTHALAISLAGKVRVNSISPGWIDTTGTEITGPDALQQPTGRVGKPEDIAEMALFLCSDKAGFITGENICIDGGMTKLMIYHGEYGWTFQS